MKINELIESTVGNMQVLNDCVDLVISRIPQKIKENDQINIQFNIDHGDVRKFCAKYSNYPYWRSIEKFSSMRIILTNDENFIRNSTIGSFSAEANQIVIYISALMRSSNDVTREELLSKRADYYPIKTFRAILLHEIRHLFQSSSYPKFYNLSEMADYVKNYQSEPIEIDAAWYHHLTDFDISNYTNAESYVNDVMKSFSDYKKLSPAWQNHYRRKTAIYFYNMKNKKNDELSSTTAKERLLINREKIKNSIVNSIHIPNSNDYNLRNLPDYDQTAGKFFLPSKIIENIRYAILKNKDIKKSTASIFYLVVAIYNPTVPTAFKKYLDNVCHISLEDALSTVDTYFPNNFDRETIKKYIATAFA
jgi:hypothetical protein